MCSLIGSGIPSSDPRSEILSPLFNGAYVSSWLKTGRSWVAMLPTPLQRKKGRLAQGFASGYVLGQWGPGTHKAPESTHEHVCPLKEKMIKEKQSRKEQTPKPSKGTSPSTILQSRDVAKTRTCPVASRELPAPAFLPTTSLSAPAHYDPLPIGLRS